LPSTTVVRSAVGLDATAACILATCCSIDPSFCTKTIWHCASIFSQASSYPFFTACQKVLAAEE